MKNPLISKIGRLAAVIGLLLQAGSCQREVDLPGQSISLSTNSLLAPAIETTLSFDIAANCNWTIAVEGNDPSWFTLSQTEATGLASVTIRISENTNPDSRSASIRVTAVRNAAVIGELKLVQAGSSIEGCISIPDVRELASGGSYTFDQAVKVRGIVASSQVDNNYLENCVAIQDAFTAGHGITIRTEKALYRNPGEELEIDLQGAVASVNAETGVLEVRPAADDAVSRTETSQIALEPVAISWSELMSGAYESMYVSLEVQVVITDLGKESLADNVTVQTIDDERFVLCVNDDATFAREAVPSGRGPLCGIATPHAGSVVVMPCTKEDIQLVSPRFDGGITLPYVFSLMTDSPANEDGRYVLFTKDSKDVRNNMLTTTDGTGSTFTAKLNSTQKAFNYWNDNSGHHNLPMGTWLDIDEDYAQFAFPLGENIDGAFRFSFGLGVQVAAPARWQLRYSTDNITWYTPEGAPHVIIPSGKNCGGGKHFFYHTIDIVPEIPLERRSTLYIRILPYDNQALNGGTVAAGNGRAQFHSCAVLERIPEFETATPAGALYFEPFDGLTEGLDYRFGDKLAGMINFCGADISEWDASLRNGLSGSNVRQRPGYAQIGYVDSQFTAQNAYKNQTGVLETPKFGAEGTLQVTFDAMAYKNMSVHSNSNALDLNGDLTSIVVEVIGGGTIDGSSSKTISGLSYTEFRNIQLTIDGATAETALRFTSQPQAGEFSRWFIDNICVTRQ